MSGTTSGRSGTPPSESAPPGGGRTSRWAISIAVLDVVLIVGLVWLLFARWRGAGFFRDLQDPVGGLLPLIVPWAGALGGVMRSLVGTAWHSHDWDDRWLIWHLIRLVAGAVAATVAFAILQTVLVTTIVTSGDVTAQPVGDGAGTGDGIRLLSTPLTPAEVGLYGGVAFVVGFVDKVFLDLVAKVTRVLFAHGDDPRGESRSPSR